MKLRATLQTKILLLAFLNLILLAAVFVVFARVQYRLDLDSFLLSPARDRILAASRLAALEFPNTPRADWDKVLAQLGSSAPAQLSLIDEDGSILAGKTFDLPADVARMLGPQRPHRPPPPLADGFGPEPPDDRPEFHQFQRPPPFRQDELTPLEFKTTYNPTQYWAATRLPLAMQHGSPPRRVTMLWRFDSLWTNPFFFNYKPWLWMTLLIVVISAACWLPFIRGLTRAVSKLKTATGQIAGGEFEISLPSNRHDEIGELSESIHAMAQRLAGYVNGQKRFLGDIAHELCSPIARIQLGLGIMDQHASTEEQPYVARVQEEIQHMSELVNELLSFSKASLGATADLETVSVAETVHKAVEREAPDASAIHSEIDPKLAVVAQRDYLFRAISNVLRNAIRYAGQAGPIVISAQQTGANIHIKITDEGPGVPPAELTEIMKPFYRPESARQRETGGVGLGLAIVRTCVDACGGTVVCRNRVPRGFEVELLLIAA